MAWSGLQLAVHYIESNNKLQPTTTHNCTIYDIKQYFVVPTHNCTIYNIKQYCGLFQSDANIYASY